jgi:2-oxoglutarate dehydrogenase E2 component (dihydrolipoamide succinyltransferase)/2-oxoisovalerate dehydrogenase E2 component (dihydrolipoyl transacylase)
VPIAVPDLGAARARFSLWYVRAGDRVTAGDRVAEVLIPGAAIDVTAPVGGVLAERTARPNEPLEPGAVIGVIEESPGGGR